MDTAIVERLTAALEALVTINAPNPNAAQVATLMKEISYIREFGGNRNELTHFIDVIDTHLSAVEESRRNGLWTAIYNSKISGSAKELLINNRTEGWEAAKLLFKQHFRPSSNYKDVSKRICNLKVILLTSLVFTIVPTNATLTLDQITTQNGYAIIKMGQTELIQDTKTILHIINTNEIRQIIDSLEHNIDELKLGNDPEIKRELQIIRAKVLAIEPTEERHKRGLINLIGTTHKWLFGTMDDTDRQDISEHITLIEQNNKNAIDQLNKQIMINSHFNDSLNNLRTTIESDRNQIKRTFQQMTDNEKRIIYQQLKLDQLFKLRTLEEKLNQIIDNIALTKHGLIHPSMLTMAELNATRMNFYKLKNVKTGLLKDEINTLILAIKIPDTYKLVDLKLLTSIPTNKNLEVIIEDQYILELNKIRYQYNKNIQYEKELHVLNNCVTNNNCKLKSNNVMEIKQLDDSTIICKNMKNLTIINKCDDRHIMLNGNYLITLNNCTIDILNQSFGNQNLKFVERFFYTDETYYNFTKEPNFDEIVKLNFENLKHIEILKMNKNVNYVTGSTIILMAIILIPVLFVLFRKNHKLKILINNKKEKPYKANEITIPNKIQENFNLNEGEVTYPIHNNKTIPSNSSPQTNDNNIFRSSLLL